MMRLMIHGEVALDALEEFCEGRKRNTSPRPRRSRITTRLKRELEAKRSLRVASRTGIAKFGSRRSGIKGCLRCAPKVLCRPGGCYIYI